MEILEQLERRLGEMLNRIKELEEENQLLSMELKDVKENRDAVMDRIDSLLKMIQGEIV